MQRLPGSEQTIKFKQLSRSGAIVDLLRAIKTCESLISK
jgi:hypothetical protein